MKKKFEMSSDGDTSKKHILDKKSAHGGKGDTGGLTISQFRAKKVDEINPFFTFFNQSQTHNKFHKPPSITIADFDF